ncbi:nickel-dependent hydrogenase large subunit [Caloramator sp. mosi_1]|nr:nickel-dependent hydrogenase large subunit [Caloramator sp. mosi_1]WDC85671.1 nickel-dependent hydrogenase large subunit [Caloramator sp. mosi_1]
MASVYKDYFNIGKGYGNFITYGVFPIEDIKDGKKLFRAGRYINGKFYSVDINKITEDSTHSYLEGTGNVGFKNSDIKVNMQRKTHILG